MATGGGKANTSRLGKIVVGRGWARGVGIVAADGAGFLLSFGSSGQTNARLRNPRCVALDHEGNFVVSDYGNFRVQVFNCRNGAHLRTIARTPSREDLLVEHLGRPMREVGSREDRHASSRFERPWGVALNDDGHLIVVENQEEEGCVQVLNYADGSHVRTIGSGHLGYPSGVAIDSDGNIVVHDGGGIGCVQIFRLSDGSHIRSIGQISGCGGVTFDAEGNLVVTCGNHIKVLNYANGSVLRVIGQVRQGGSSSDEEEALPVAVAHLSQADGVAFDSAGHLVVVDSGNHSVQVLNYADGSHVRTIGSYGQQAGCFYNPSGIAIDCDGRIIVCDYQNSRVQVLQ